MKLVGLFAICVLAVTANAEKFYLATLSSYSGKVRYFQRYQKNSRPVTQSDRGSLHLKAGDRFQLLGSGARVAIQYRGEGGVDVLSPTRESDGNTYCYVDARRSSEQLALTGAIGAMVDPRITKRMKHSEPVFSPAEDDTLPLFGLAFLRTKDNAADSKVYLLSWRAREYDEVALPVGVLSVDGAEAAKSLEPFRHDDKSLTLYLSHPGESQELWRTFHIMARNEEKAMQSELDEVDGDYSDKFERLIARADVHMEHKCVVLAEQDLVAALKVRSYPELVDKVKELALRVGDTDSASQIGSK